MPRLLTLLTLLLSLPVLADERILSFDSTIMVEPGGDLLVTELIEVRAEGIEIQRGIFRDIPRLQQTKWGLMMKKPFKVLEVLQDGKPATYEVSDIGKGGIRIRIGRADVLLSRGLHTYEIQYRTGRQLYFEEDRDVLYWNVNGTEWGFPSDKVTATVTLPEGLGVTRVDGSTGRYGDTGRAFQAESTGSRATFAATSSFAAKEGLTIVVEWPPGKLDPAAYAQAESSLLKDHPGVLAAILLLVGALVYYLLAWIKVGKDPAKGIIIPLFEPPAGFSPAAVRYLNRMGFDNTCFSAGVVGLAVKGVATIDQEGKTYTLKSRGLEHQKEALEPDELQLYNKLLGNTREVELKQANHARIGGARKAFQKMLSSKLEKTHFLRNLKWWIPGLLLSLLGTLLMVLLTGKSDGALFLLLWLSIWTIGTSAMVSRCYTLWRSGSWGVALGTTLFALPFAGFWVGGAVGFFLMAGPWAGAAFLFTGLTNVLFYHLIKAPTHLGRKVMDHIEGFRHYLSVAEEDRLNLQNPPEKTPELFERFLPYALALDCEQNWSEKFDEVLQAAGTAPGQTGRSGYHPTFYSGSNTGFNSAMTAAAIGGAITGALASSSSAPSSSGSSGGGGGSSGGGGGGGGGGGW